MKSQSMQEELKVIVSTLHLTFCSNKVVKYTWFNTPNTCRFLGNTSKFLFGIYLILFVFFMFLIPFLPFIWIRMVFQRIEWTMRSGWKFGMRREFGCRLYIHSILIAGQIWIQFLILIVGLFAQFFIVTKVCKASFTFQNSKILMMNIYVWLI